MPLCGGDLALPVHFPTALDLQRFQKQKAVDECQRFVSFYQDRLGLKLVKSTGPYTRPVSCNKAPRRGRVGPSTHAAAPPDDCRAPPLLPSSSDGNLTFMFYRVFPAQPSEICSFALRLTNDGKYERTASRTHARRTQPRPSASRLTLPQQRSGPGCAGLRDAVVTCDPPVLNASALVDELNKTNNLSKFVRDMRKGFRSSARS